MAVLTHRVGSVPVNGTTSMSYFPYGQERVVTGNGTDKFVTYFRDPNGIDYAQQRYYGSMYRRFLTPDPSGLNEKERNEMDNWGKLQLVPSQNGSGTSNATRDLVSLEGRSL